MCYEVKWNMNGEEPGNSLHMTLQHIIKKLKINNENLTTTETIWYHLTLAACYQLAQFVL